MKYAIFLFLFFIITNYLKALEPNLIQYTDGNEPISVSGKDILFYEDIEGKIKETAYPQLPFKRMPGEVINFAFSKSHFIMKVKLKNNSSQSKLLINIDSPNLDLVKVVYFENRKPVVTILGELVPYSKRQYKFAPPIIDIPFSSNEERIIYIVIRNNEQLFTPIFIGSESQILQKASIKKGFFYLYMGIILSILLYNFFLYLSLREKTYLKYCLFTAAVGFSQIFVHGYALEVFYAEINFIGRYWAFIMPILSGVFGIIFTRDFLNVKNVKYADKTLTVFMVAYLLTMGLGLLGFYIEAQQIMQMVAMMVSGVFLTISAILSRRGDKTATFYLIAYGLFLGGIIIFVLGNFGILPHTGVIEYAMPFGSAAEVILLSFALADKINILKKEKEKAQALANQRLEEEVQIRTSELNETLTKVNALKNQQDGDYFLTSQIVNPLNTVQVTNSNVQIEFFLKQKKKFQFKKWQREIGGDFCSAHELVIDNKKMVLLINADAMGKSIQGASGIIVLGSIFHATVERTKNLSKSIQFTPERFLKNTILEFEKTLAIFDSSMLISFVLGLLDTESGCLYHVSIEHPEIVLYRNQSTSFLKRNFTYFKLGNKDFSQKYFIDVTQLQPGDSIFMGSDGRDDILIEKEGKETMNVDELGFGERVKLAQGNLRQIYELTEKAGRIVDDFSILKVTYQPEVEPEKVFIEKLNTQLNFYRDDIEKLREKDERASKYLDNQDQDISAETQTANLIRLLKILKENQMFELAFQLSKLLATYFPSQTKLILMLAYFAKKCNNIHLAIDLRERVRLREPQNEKNFTKLIESYILVQNLERARELLNDFPEFKIKNSLLDKKLKKFESD